MAADNPHSRAVLWLKIILPLAALAILSSIFLVSRTIDPNDAIPYAQVDVADRIRDPRLTGPVFSGMTSDGSAVTVNADQMRPDRDNPGKGTARILRARLEAPDGGFTEVAAPDGRMDTVAATIDLTGGVVVTSSTGYRVRAPEMTGLLDRTDLTATGGVTADGPLGTITSDSMHLTRGDGPDGRYLLVFNDRVRLVYLPQK